jgi:hypothetical protein
LKKLLINIREFLWPILEGPIDTDRDSEPKDIDLVISDENLEEAFKQQLRIYDSEEERRKGIETKASLFISTISVATSIVVAANALVTGNQVLNLPIKASVIITFILSLYAVRTVWFSIKALERGSYYVLGIDDINVRGVKPQFYKHLIRSLQTKTLKNQPQINSKVDYFTLAQEYYKRAIILICVYSFLILVFCLFFKRPSKWQSPAVINKTTIGINLPTVRKFEVSKFLMKPSKIDINNTKSVGLDPEVLSK